MGLGSMLGAGVVSSENIEEMPVLGINGVVIAENVEELISSGARFSKISSESDKRRYLDKRKQLNKEFHNDTVKKMWQKAFFGDLEEKGLKEGVDYEVAGDDVIFK